MTLQQTETVSAWAKAFWNRPWTPLWSDQDARKPFIHRTQWNAAAKLVWTRIQEGLDRAQCNRTCTSYRWKFWSVGKSIENIIYFFNFKRIFLNKKIFENIHPIVPTIRMQIFESFPIFSTSLEQSKTNRRLVLKWRLKSFPFNWIEIPSCRRDVNLLATEDAAKDFLIKTACRTSQRQPITQTNCQLFCYGK